MSRIDGYQCNRCGEIDNKTIFSGDKYSNNGWLQVTTDIHYCPACADKYEVFLSLEEGD